jgi:hypothetical protein
MKLIAAFESWHLGDGNYPPLRRGQLVSHDDPESFENLGDDRYRFCATVLKVYNGEDPIVILEVNEFRFYVNAGLGVAVGSRVAGEGSLAFDHYLWVEFLDRYDAPPDLFYSLRVERIRAVDRRGRTETDLSASTEVREVEDMKDDKCSDYYLIDLNSDGLREVTIPRTFL